ncbi:MAG: PepSY domain-containing protein [Methylobacterium mesophilicum]|nr:PepSY domain-containing protein [Methylobacterium mesophilicum]
MRITMLAGILLASLAATSTVRADDDGRDQAGPDWMSEQQIRDKAKSLNLDVQRVSVDDGYYEVDARDSNGRQIDVRFDPKTGEETSTGGHH